jgi:hypothetical protein
VLNVADHCAQLVLPLLVAAVLGPTVNAGFYIAALVAGFCWIVPAHLGTGLFAVAADDRPTLRVELRTALAAAVLTWAVGTAGAVILGRTVLAAFGGEYEAAAPALVWLVAATLPFSVRCFYGAVCRVDRRLVRGATVTAACATANVVVAVATVSFGISVMTAALFVAGVVQASWLWPTVGRAAGLPIRAVPA